MNREQAIREMQAIRRILRRTERDMFAVLDDPAVTPEQREKATAIIRLKFEGVYQELDKRELALGVRPKLRRFK